MGGVEQCCCVAHRETDSVLGRTSTKPFAGHRRQCIAAARWFQADQTATGGRGAYRTETVGSMCHWKHACRDRGARARELPGLEPDGEKVEIPVTGGNVKMQWKPDWAMRWAALGVDYEMSGKDLIDSVTQSSKICRALGKQPPESLSYELFNDEQGQKISKSKGNGLSMEEWLTYAAPESLSYFMYQKPKTAKRMHFDVIPKAVDEYHQQLRAYADQDDAKRLANPVFHIHGHNVPASNMVVPFSMLLNLASVSSAEDKTQMWGFIQRYAPDASPETHPDLDEAAGFAVRYYNDFVKPTKTFRAPDEKEKGARTPR